MAEQIYADQFLSYFRYPQRCYSFCSMYFFDTDAIYEDTLSVTAWQRASVSDEGFVGKAS